MPASCRNTLYYTTIYPYLTYGIKIWGTATKELLNKLTKLQNKAIRIVGRAEYNSPIKPLLHHWDFLQLNENLSVTNAKVHALIQPREVTKAINHIIHQKIANSSI